MGVVYGFLSSAAFGLIPLFTLPMLAMGISVETILVYRFAIAAFIMAILLFARGESFAIGWRAALKVAGLSIFYMLAVQFFFQGFWYLPSGWVATIQFLFPVMVMVIMILFFHEPFRWAIGASAFLAFAGVGILSLGAPEPPGANVIWDPARAPLGILFALLAGLFNALYFVGIQVARLRINGLILTFYVMFFGAVFCAASGAAQGNMDIIASSRGLFLALMLALITAVLSNLTLILAIRRLGSTITSILSVMEPVTAVGVGIAVFHEPFTSSLILALLIITASVLLALLGPRQRRA